MIFRTLCFSSLLLALACGDSVTPDASVDSTTGDMSIDTTPDADLPETVVFDDGVFDDGVPDQDVPDENVLDQSLPDQSVPDLSVPDADVPSLPEPMNHRPTAVACDRMRPAGGGPFDPGPFPNPACTQDSDCTMGENGRCMFGRGGPVCSYDECFTDAECGMNVCICDANGAGAFGANRCGRSGACQVDADCPGSWCSPSLGSCGNYGGIQGYFCRTADDTCLNDSDCKGEPNRPGDGYCAYQEATSSWACQYTQCVG